MKVQIIKWSLIAVDVVSASSVAYALRSRWLPRMQQAVSRLLNPTADAKPSDDSHQGPTGSISLTAQAKKNISLHYDLSNDFYKIIFSCTAWWYNAINTTFIITDNS